MVSTDQCAPPSPPPQPQPPPTQWVLYRQVLQMVMEWCFSFLLQVSLFLHFKRIIPALPRVRRAGVALRGLHRTPPPPEVESPPTRGWSVAEQGSVATAAQGHSHDTSAQRWTWGGNPLRTPMTFHRVFSFSPDSKLLLTTSADKTCKLWDVAEKTVTRYVRVAGRGFRRPSGGPPHAARPEEEMPCGWPPPPRSGWRASVSLAREMAVTHWKNL